MALVCRKLRRRNVFNIEDRDIASRSLVIAALLFVSQVSSGQEPDTQGTEDRVQMEELIVSAPRSLRSMRVELAEAKDTVYSLFNSLNDDRSYDILCRRERPIKDGFSPMSVTWTSKVCLTRFIRTETARANADYMDGYTDGSMTYLTGEFRERGDILTQKFNDLMRENPEFYNAMYNYTVLNKNYELALAEDKDKGFFSRIFRPKDKR